jgi:Mg-chelatase subunit ChlD
VSAAPSDRLTRWRLLLGANAGCNVPLNADLTKMDQALSALYEPPKERKGGLGASSPQVARWLGDIRQYFPSQVVRVMQKDALTRLNLQRMLLEPELLETVTPDVHLVGTLLALAGAMPAKTKQVARQVVGRLVDELMRQLEARTREAVRGALNRAARNNRPRHAEIDWPRTIRANLKHYQPDYESIIPERLIGYGRRRSSLKDVILCLDQSGSMAASVIYASVFGAVLASLPALRTRVVAFDTNVVDLSERCADPVDVLFGVQLGGGTDIAQALRYCRSQVRRPADTIVVLISDLYEGGDNSRMHAAAAELIGAGAQLITLLALSDQGKPGYDPRNAEAFAALGSPAFACTPDAFPELMAMAIQRHDISAWAARRGLTGDGKQES